MKVCVLASGSKGNSTYIEVDGKKMLIDVGMNNKYLNTKLNELGISIKDIDYILISHLHDDHISALKTVLNKSKACLLMTSKMFKELNNIKDYENVIIYEDEYFIGNLKITAIKSSHDSPDSRNFILESGNSSVVYITDTGYVKATYFNILKNRSLYLMESNHDIEMLNNGPYPKWLKKRVLSDYGHLSNNASSFYLTKLIGSNTQKVILMHLSEVNNTKEKSLETLKNTLDEYNIKFDKIEISDQFEKSELIEV